MKIVLDRAGFALYFSRAPIPHARDPRGGWPPLYRHVGLYAYRRSTLLVLASLEPTPLERTEALEQLRALEHGIRIRAVETAYDSIGVDTPEDLEQVRRLLAASAVELMMSNTKYIFVTGGVVSSLGKGLAAASIGALLEGHGYTVTLQKFDPYINVDPGTMSPYQHGEVYVTDDGAETDLDLGHYERFTNTTHGEALELDDRQDLPERHPEGAARRLSRPHRSGDSAHHERNQGRNSRGRRRTWTSRSWKSAARSATSRACRFSRPSGSSGRTSDATTRSTST